MNTYIKLLTLLLLVNQGYISTIVAATVTPGSPTAPSGIVTANSGAANTEYANIDFTTKDRTVAFSGNVMESFSGTHTNLANTPAFKAYVGKKLRETNSELLFDESIGACLSDVNLPLPKNDHLTRLLGEFQRDGYKQYVQNLASFTGGGAKGMMEILAVVVIEEQLNTLPQEVRDQIIERRVERYYKANPGRRDTNIVSRLKEDKYIYFQDVVDGFAGTSTGSIIAAGLAYMKPIKDATPGYVVGYRRYKAYEVAQLYYRHLPDIFVSSGYTSARKGLTGAQYDKSGLIGMLKTFFGNDTFIDAFPNKNIKIALTELQSGDRGSVYSIAEVDSPYWCHLSVAKAVEGSSSAPTFFTDLEIAQGQSIRKFVDGGLCLNSLVEKITRSWLDKYPNSLLNVVSFGAGNKPRTDHTPPESLIMSLLNRDLAALLPKGFVLEAVKALEGRVGGEVVEAHTECCNMLKVGKIRSFSHLNPVLIDGMGLDSVTTNFINKAFTQIKKELATPVLAAIMSQLLEFIPQAQPEYINTLEVVTNFHNLWERAYLKVVLLDFTQPKLIFDTRAQPGRSDPTHSCTFRVQSAAELVEAQSKWLGIYLDRIGEEELVKILRKTLIDDPFKNFVGKNYDTKLQELESYLKVVFDEESSSRGAASTSTSRAQTIVASVRTGWDATSQLTYIPTFDLLQADIDKINALKPDDIGDHAATLFNIIKTHGVTYHTEHKVDLLFQTYTDTVFRGVQIAQFKTIADILDALLLAEHNGCASTLKWLFAAFSSDTTSRGSAFRQHLITHNLKVEAKRLAIASSPTGSPVSSDRAQQLAFVEDVGSSRHSGAPHRVATAIDDDDDKEWRPLGEDHTAQIRKLEAQLLADRQEQERNAQQLRREIDKITREALVRATDEKADLQRERDARARERDGLNVQIAAHLATIAAGDATIAGHVRTIAQRDATIAGIPGQLAPLNVQILALQQQAAQQIAALQAQVAYIPGLQEQIEELTARLTELNRTKLNTPGR